MAWQCQDNASLGDDGCVIGKVDDETAASASGAMQRVWVKRVCDDKGSTDRVECLGRPCTYTIVKCATGVCGAPAGSTGSGISWSQALAPTIEKARAVGWNQETANLASPDRIFMVTKGRTDILPKDISTFNRVLIAVQE